MKSCYSIVQDNAGDPEPPGPTPIPIRIVADAPPPPSSIDGERISISTRKNHEKDMFYNAWDKFLALAPGRARTMSGTAQAISVQQAEVENSPGAEGLQVQENAAKSWEAAVAECKSKVAAIVEECGRLNQKYRDVIFDLEANPGCLQSLDGRYPSAMTRIGPPPWIKRISDIFTNPQFFIDGATAQDVHQGSGGDCWFLAALMAVSAKPSLIEDLCVARNEEAGVYGFVFYRDSEWIVSVIDDKLFLRVGDDDALTLVRDWDKAKKQGLKVAVPDDDKLKEQLQKGGEALYFSHCKSDETWLPLIEKAYAKAHGDYFAIEGGHASEAIEDLTGGVAVVINPEDIMSKDRFWREQLSLVNEKYLFGGGTQAEAARGFIGGHAYAVLRAYEEGDLRLLKLRNPWGSTEWEGDWSDGSRLWTPEMMKKLDHTFGDDGVFWISYEDFLKHFRAINRVRLFGKDWSVAQQWTSVNVPWTVDYLDTKFQFTIDKRCPVVVVLSQPDDRYFSGLTGRFMVSMHFRVYKEGEAGAGGRWIVRSMHNSGNETAWTRSVSVEIEDLEPGTYDVVFKVTAARVDAAESWASSIRKYAVEKKEKLLDVGRRFDYAVTKGNMRGMEEAVRKRELEELKEEKRGMYKKTRKLTRMEKARAKKRKQRVEEAMKEKKKEFEGKRREKMKARQERRELRRKEREERAEKEEKAVVAEKEEREGTMERTESDESDGKVETVTPESDASPIKEVEKTVLPEGGGPAAGKTDAAAKEGTEDAIDASQVVVAGAEKEEAAHVTKTDSPEDSKEEAAETSKEDETTETKAEEVAEANTTADALSKDLSKLDLAEKKESSGEEPVSPVSRVNEANMIEEEDSFSDSSLEPPSDLDDDDFDWNSDIDGPLFSDDADDEDEDAKAASKSAQNKVFFGDDPWNCLVVLGLRVYALNAEAKVRVVKGENDS